MLAATQLQRIFSFEDNGEQLQLADPSPSFSPESVLNFYAQTYPVLTTARIEGPEIENDAVQYKFVTTLGTKG